MYDYRRWIERVSNRSKHLDLKPVIRTWWTQGDRLCRPVMRTWWTQGDRLCRFRDPICCWSTQQQRRNEMTEVTSLVKKQAQFWFLQEDLRLHAPNKMFQSTTEIVPPFFFFLMFVWNLPPPPTLLDWARMHNTILPNNSNSIQSKKHYPEISGRFSTNVVNTQMVLTVPTAWFENVEKKIPVFCAGGFQQQLPKYIRNKQ